MSKTMAWKVYGINGKQGESYEPSFLYDFSEPGDARIIECENSDKTGTNAYAILRITRNSWEECIEERDGQISDGVFENYSVGDIVECENGFDMVMYGGRRIL